MNAVHVRTARPPVRYLCTFCAAHVANADALRTAPNPFDPRDTLTGCPACGAVNATVRTCDEPGCWQPADSGFPTPDGYRSTCSKHIPLAGEPRCQHESSPDDGTRPVGEHTGVPAAFPERTNMNTTNDGWGQYKRKGVSEMRPYVPGEDMAGISVSAPDKENGSPKPGDMIARNPKNHEDQWLVAAKYFAENLEPA